MLFGKNNMKQILTLLSFIAFAQAFSQPVVLSQRQQAEIIDNLLEDRLTTVLPKLMERENIDMWVVISREYNEDPIIETLLPATWMAARRTTMLVMYNPGNGKSLDCFAVSRYPVGKIFKSAWDPEQETDQWKQLAQLIEERKPKVIAVNTSAHTGLADGISVTELANLKSALSPAYSKRVQSGERLGIAWLETRSAKEMELYPAICKIAHDIIKEGFSEKVVKPGVTTTEDVVWWYRERIKELKLDTWFHPSVSIDRNEPYAIFAKRIQPLVILPGDLLHVDFGITYLRLNTDTQQHAYVLKENETDAPEDLKQALAYGNQLQDILTSNFKEGRSGNEILAMSRKKAIESNLKPSIYTHPIGFHGHAAGTTIGMWDMQNGVPFNGDYTMHFNTAYSIELNVTTNIPSWKKEIQIKLEEDGFFSEKGFNYIDGRQTQLILIPSAAAK